MPTVSLAPTFGVGYQAFTTGGKPLTAGLIYTYEAGSTTPQATYTTSAGSVPNANPIELDADGRPPSEVWLIASATYRFDLKDADGNLIKTYDNFGGISSSGDLANTSTVTLGDALVGFKQSNASGNITGAVGSTVHHKLQETVSIKDFGAVGDGVTDDTDAIQAALDYALSLLPTATTQPDNASGYSYGSVRIWVPAGVYLIDENITIPPYVTLEGDGSGSSVFVFSFNGSCITNDAGGGFPFDDKKGKIVNLRIRGTTSASSQILLDLLGYSWGEVTNVEVEASGGIGIRLRRCLGSRFSRVRVSGCIGKGWQLTAEAAFPTLFCNGNVFVDCVGWYNQAEGMQVDGAVGNVWIGGVFEQNFSQTAYTSIGTNDTAATYQVQFTSTARGNRMDGTWFEGSCQALLYHNLSASNATQFNHAHNCTFIPSSTTSRAVVCNTGTILITDPSWQATAFPSINSSTAPFRLSKTNVGRIYLRAVAQTGTSVDDDLMVEDPNGNDANFTGLTSQTVFSGANWKNFVRMQLFQENGQVGLDVFRTTASGGTDWDEFPYFQMDAANRAIRLGSGTGGTDTLIKWIAADVLGTDDTFVVQSNTAIPAGGTAGVGLRMSSTSNFGVFFGSGAPSLAAAKGSLYLRSDGSGATDRAYINTDGSTTWTAITTVG